MILRKAYSEEEQIAKRFCEGLYYSKVKVLLSYFPTSNAKSLACDTANEHALTIYSNRKNV